MPESTALTNLASLIQSGYESSLKTGALGALTRASVLYTLHLRLVEEFGPSAAEHDWVRGTDDGARQFQLAALAEESGADDLAAQYLDQSIDLARSLGAWDGVANRMAELRLVRDNLGDTEGAAAAVQELESLLERPDLSPYFRAVAHSSIAAYLEKHGAPLEDVIDHLRNTQEELSRHTGNLPPGVGRAGAVREFEGNARWPSRLLHRAGHDRDAFTILQFDKGRRILESAASLHPEIGGAPWGIADLMSDLAELDARTAGTSTSLVDLAVDETSVTAYVLSAKGLIVVEERVATRDLDRLAAGDIHRRESSVVAACLDRMDLRRLIECIDTEIPDGAALLVVPDGPLVNLPLHLVPCKGVPWADRHPIGYLPHASFLRMAARPRPWLGRSLIVGDSLDNVPGAALPGAAAECREIAKVLGARALVGSRNAPSKK